MTLVPVDTTSEVAVTSYLAQARDWLSRAVDETGPKQIAAAKAEIATAAEATKQLNLSKDIQLDAQEMVRRAEFALGRAIRKGQAEGALTTSSDGGPRSDYIRDGRVVRVSPGDPDTEATKMSTRQFFTNGEQWHETLAMADGASPEEFEQVLEAAKAEGNLSRANVVRKVKQQAGPTTRDQRAELISDLAAQGYSSRQMPAKVGVTEETVRQIARDFDIEIPADKYIGRTRRIDHTQMVESTVTDLVNATEFIEAQIDLSQVDFTEADEWLSSLTTSIRVLNRFKQQIKENSHV